MKHKVAFLSIAAIAVGALLVACSANTDQSGEADNSASEGPWKIGYSTFFQGNSWQAQNAQIFEEECDKLKSKEVSDCKVVNADSDTTKQISQIRGLVNQGYDAILLDANSPTGLNNVVQEALDAGVKVINFDSIIEGDATSKINTNQEKWGTETGQWLIDELNGEGKIVVLNGTAGSPISEARYSGAKKLFEETPGIEIVADAFADWDQATAQSAMSSIISGNPEIDGVWSQGGAMSAGAILELQKAHRELVPITGEAYNGFLKLWVENLDDGFSSIAPAQPNYLVTISLKAAMDSLAGEEIPADVDVPLPIITDEDVNEYYDPDKSDSYWVFDSISDEEINKLLGEGE